MQFSGWGDQTFNKGGYGEMVNGKTQRYASRGLNESVVHIAEQINSVWRQRWWTNYNQNFWELFVQIASSMFSVEVVRKSNFGK